MSLECRLMSLALIHKVFHTRPHLAVLFMAQ